MNILRQRPFNTPASTVDPLQNCGVTDAYLPRPLGEGLCFTVVRKKGVVALIVGLFDIVCPAAVRRLVITIHIDSVNGVARRAFAHILKKAGEGLPFFANGNTATAVIRPLMVIGVGTPSFHVAPAVVSSWGLRSVAAGCYSVFEVSLRCFFVAQASARFGFSTGKTAAKDSSILSAITSAVPVNPGLSEVSGLNTPASKSFAGMIGEFAHKLLPSVSLNYSELRLYRQVTLGAD